MLQPPTSSKATQQGGTWPWEAAQLVEEEHAGVLLDMGCPWEERPSHTLEAVPASHANAELLTAGRSK